MKTFRLYQALPVAGHGVLREFRDTDGWAVYPESETTVSATKGRLKLVFHLSAGFLVFEGEPAPAPTPPAPKPQPPTPVMGKRRP